MGNKGSASIQENYRKKTHVVLPRGEDERGAHSEENARCRHTREKKKRPAKPRVERGLLERYYCYYYYLKNLYSAFSG